MTLLCIDTLAVNWNSILAACQLLRNFVGAEREFWLLVLKVVSTKAEPFVSILNGACKVGEKLNLCQTKEQTTTLDIVDIMCIFSVIYFHYKTKSVNPALFYTTWCLFNCDNHLQWQFHNKNVRHNTIVLTSFNKIPVVGEGEHFSFLNPFLWNKSIQTKSIIHLHPYSTLQKIYILWKV